MARGPVVIVGAGNAAFCAALAARERGAEVLMLERAMPEEAGEIPASRRARSAASTTAWTIFAR